MRLVTLIADAKIGTQSLVAGVSVEVDADLAAQWEAEGKVASDKPKRGRKPAADAADAPAADASGDNA